MNTKALMLATLLFIAFSGVGVSAAWADGVLFKVRMPDTNYCHLKFPAIREDTLSWDRPVLKSSGTSDIIDFYGPCNHDPTGEREVRRQSRAELRDILQDGE